MRMLTRNTEFVRFLIDQNVKEGDIVIDATLGNANDAIYLSNAVGTKGQVYAFDIQEIAINRSKEKIDKLGLTNIKLIQDGHENVDKYVINENIKFTTFNLGYLPNGDKTIITMAENTIKAIKKILNITVKGGIVSIISYYEHEGGRDEFEKINEFLLNLDEEKYNVIKVSKHNTKTSSPITFIVMVK